MNKLDALKELEKLKDKPKYEAMIKTASIITKLLEPKNIRPIIVGGLSVELYTQNEYSTRDIDFVSTGYHEIEDILFSLNFKKDGRHFYRDDIEVAIEIPDSHLAGDEKKVIKAYVDEQKYVYVISREDLILDRLRAAVNWKSEEDAIWGFRLLSKNHGSIDKNYLLENTETMAEKKELESWIKIISEETE